MPLQLRSGQALAAVAGTATTTEWVTQVTMGFALSNRPEPGSWALDFVNGGLFIAGILCLFFAMVLIAFGPAILVVQANTPLEVL